MIIWLILGLIALVLITLITWYLLSPQFGRRANAQQLSSYSDYTNHNGKVFINPEPIDMKIDFIPTLLEWFKKDPTRQPQQELKPQTIMSEDFSSQVGEKPRLYWFGHSAFMLLVDGQKILIDPMFGQHSAPHPWLGTKRYSSELPLKVEEFPEIDIVLISHDHYDHLDYPSIKKLKDRVKKFLVPLGMGNHLKSWGVSASQIQEFNWEDSLQLSSLKFTYTPARHFSGRGLSDRFETLWGSWVVQSSRSKIYFSGDSGYGSHFQAIGAKHGPFDLALMECGQYNPAWADVHMTPEESVQAALDLNAERYMPIHWAGFTLSFHSWTDPVERSLLAAKEAQIEFISPKIGELIDLRSSHLPKSRWWEEL